MISRARDPRSVTSGRAPERAGGTEDGEDRRAVDDPEERDGAPDETLDRRRGLPADGAGGAGASASGDDGDESEELPKLEGERLRACLEALLFAAPEAISRRRLYRLLPEADAAAIRDALLELEGELRSTHRGFSLVEEAAGFRLLTRPEFAPFVARLRGERRRIRLSAAAFETLAVIAYRQPVRRADLEAIRGVQSMAILKNLMEWNLIQVLGTDDTPGRPLLYGTTGEFLEMLGLSSLEDLPEPERLRERGADRGLEILDRIIGEGGGAAVVAAEAPLGAEAVEGIAAAIDGGDEADEADEAESSIPSARDESGVEAGRDDDDDDDDEDEDDDFDDDDDDEDDDGDDDDIDDDDEDDDDDFDDDDDDFEEDDDE